MYTHLMPGSQNFCALQSHILSRLFFVVFVMLGFFPPKILVLMDMLESSFE